MLEDPDKEPTSPHDPGAVADRARAVREGQPSDHRPDIADRSGLPPVLREHLKRESGGS